MAAAATLTCIYGRGDDASSAVGGCDGGGVDSGGRSGGVGDGLAAAFLTLGAPGSYFTGSRCLLTPTLGSMLVTSQVE